MLTGFQFQKKRKGSQYAQAKHQNAGGDFIEKPKTGRVQ
jgi:hypothetical protein